MVPVLLWPRTDTHTEHPESALCPPASWVSECSRKRWEGRVGLEGTENRASCSFSCFPTA